MFYALQPRLNERYLQLSLPSGELAGYLSKVGFSMSVLINMEALAFIGRALVGRVIVTRPCMPSLKEARR